MVQHQRSSHHRLCCLSPPSSPKPPRPGVMSSSRFQLSMDALLSQWLIQTHLFLSWTLPVPYHLRARRGNPSLSLYKRQPDPCHVERQRVSFKARHLGCLDTNPPNRPTASSLGQLQPAAWSCHLLSLCVKLWDLLTRHIPHQKCVHHLELTFAPGTILWPTKRMVKLNEVHATLKKNISLLAETERSSMWTVFFQTFRCALRTLASHCTGPPVPRCPCGAAYKAVVFIKKVRDPKGGPSIHAIHASKSNKFCGFGRRNPGWKSKGLLMTEWNQLNHRKSQPSVAGHSKKEL